jgi:hypothetical protein
MEPVPSRPVRQGVLRAAHHKTESDTLQLPRRDDVRGSAPRPRQDVIGVVGLRERCNVNGTTDEVTVKVAPQKSQENAL